MDRTENNQDSRISHLSLSARVHQTLRAWLSGGELEPGQKLTGRILAEKLGVSQTPVREALLQLVAEHALTMNPNRSITVPVLSKEKFIELRDMRVALEGLAAKFAASQCSEKDLLALEKLHQDMMQAKNGGDFKNTLRLNRLIHFSVCEMSGREELFAMIQSLWARTGPYLNFLYRNIKTNPDLPHPHEKLLLALKTHNPALAEAAIAQDIIEGGADILSAL
jgi:GntR family colanic acid and biofilm gene transcriptional regulator